MTRVFLSLVSFYLLQTMFERRQQGFHAFSHSIWIARHVDNLYESEIIQETRYCESYTMITKECVWIGKSQRENDARERKRRESFIPRLDVTWRREGKRIGRVL